jgi:hypothetical protein
MSKELGHLRELLARLNLVSNESFETFADAEAKLLAHGIRVLGRDPLRLEWSAPAKARLEPSPLPPPTLLVSPYGLAILEALFSKSDEDLGCYRSMFEFARENGLNQPKLSHFKTHLKASDLKNLKARLRSISFEAWVRAFDYPNTSKGMTPFFRTLRAYLPATPDPNPGKVSEFFDAHELIEGRDWFPGPDRQPLGKSALISSGESLWVNEVAERKLKKHLKLIPALRSSSSGPGVIHLARPKKTFEKEALVVSGPDLAIPNRFRTVWDLVRGESRLREVGLEFLKEILGK